MAGFVGQLRARLGLDSAEFSNGLRNARQQATGFSASMAQGMRGLTTVALGASALGAAALAGAVQVRNLMRDIAAVGDEAARAGLPVEDYQEFAFVATQARVPLDALTDGFKELSLRADEWIQTGSGPGEESFRRLGFTAEDLARRLQRPSDLFVEIVRRMQRLDTAARMRISDQLFGGTAGERFVALIDQGADSLSDTIERARGLGLVLDRDVIARATILNSKFTELTHRATALLQTAAVALFAGGVETAADTLERLFGTLDRARAILGEPLFNELIAQTGELSDRTEGVVEDLSRVADAVDRDVTRVARSMAEVTGQLSDLGMIDQMLSFDSVISEMETLVARFRAGQISASDFDRELEAAVINAIDALSALEDIDGISTADAQAQITALQRTLASARAEARGLSAEVQNGPIGMDSGVPLDTVTLPQDTLGGRRSHAPPRAPTEGSPAYGGRGAGAGGGGGSTEDYAGAVADIRARTEALTAEAAALAEVAASGRDYGDAAAYARERAELLNRAQREGREITPELTAEIDALAQANTAAQSRVDGLTDALTRQREAGERGAEAVTDLFMAAAQGGDAARNAVIRLALEIARMQALRAFQGMAGSSGGGWLRWLGGLLGKNARGTESWRGGATVVGEEGPEIVNLPTGSRITPALESAQMLRSGGGGVSRLEVGLSPDLEARILDTAGQQTVAITRAHMAAADRALPGRVKHIQRNPRNT